MIKIHTCEPGYNYRDFYFRDYKEAVKWIQSVDWKFLEEKSNFNCFVQMEPIYFYYSEKKNEKNKD